MLTLFSIQIVSLILLMEKIAHQRRIAALKAELAQLEMANTAAPNIAEPDAAPTEAVVANVNEPNVMAGARIRLDTFEVQPLIHLPTLCAQ